MERCKLPEGWEWKRLLDLFDLKNGGTPAKERLAFWSNGTVPFVTAADLMTLYVDSGRASLTEDGLASGKTVICEPGDILIGTRTRVGNCSVARTRMGASQDVTRARPTRELVPEFLCLFLRHVGNEMAFYSQGTSIQGITRDLLRELLVPFPPISVQHRVFCQITDHMAQLDRIVTAREARDVETADLPRDLTRSIYLMLIREFGGVPMGSVATILGGGTPSKSNGAYWQGTIPWVAPIEMKSWEIADTTLHISKAALAGSAAKLIPPPAVLFVVRGMILARTVPVAVTRRPLAINQDMKALVPKPGWTAEFIAFMMRGTENLLLDMVDVAGHGTRTLPTDRWMALPIPNAPETVQKEVVAELTLAQAKITEMALLQRESTTALQALIPALLSKAFQGDL